MTYQAFIWVDNLRLDLVHAVRCLWRCKGRHRYLLDIERDRVSLLCARCGKRSVGWNIALGRQAGAHGDEAA